MHAVCVYTVFVRTVRANFLGSADEPDETPLLVFPQYLFGGNLAKLKSCFIDSRDRVSIEQFPFGEQINFDNRVILKSHSIG